MMDKGIFFFFVNNVDLSLLDVRICGYKMIKVPLVSNSRLARIGRNYFNYSIDGIDTHIKSFIYYEGNDQYFLAFVKQAPSKRYYENQELFRSFILTLMLFKPSGICMSQGFYINESGESTVIHINNEFRYYNGTLLSCLKLDSDEITELERFHPQLEKYVNNHDDKILNNMIKIWLEAYPIEAVSIKCVGLVTILEMLSDNRKNIKRNITSGIVALLSNSDNDTIMLTRQTRELYKIRSKYVHEGRLISKESLNDAIIFSSAVIKRFIELNVTIGVDVESFRKALNSLANDKPFMQHHLQKIKKFEPENLELDSANI